jgi:hypothetical protein
MKLLLFLVICGVAWAAPVTVKKPAKPVAEKPSGPSDAAIEAAVKTAVETHVGKNSMGKGARAVVKVEEVRPLAGWTGRYSVTGYVVITTRTPHGDYKATKTFSAMVETEGTSVKRVTDVSV